MKQKRISQKAPLTKRLVCLLACLLCASLTMLSGARVAGASSAADIGDNLGYWPNHLSYTDGTLRVDGCFFNHNPAHDIGEMTGFTLTLCDADNREIVSLDVAAGTDLERIILPSSATVDYSFTIPNCKIDASLYNLSAFRATIHCAYRSYHCRGAGVCSICAPWRPFVPPTPTPMPTPMPTPPYKFIQVKCEQCDGDGSYPCTLCDKGILYYETKRSIDLGGGSTTYEVPVYCRMCKNGRVWCVACIGQGFRWEMDL